MATSSRIISEQYIDSGPTGSPAYLVTKRVSSTSVLDLAKSTDLASVIDKDPGELLTTASDSTRTGRMRLRSADVRHVPGSNGLVVDVSYRFDSMYTWCDTGSSGRPASLALPVVVDFDSTPRSVTMYRTSSGGYTTNPSANLNTSTDIGGTKVDYGTRPLSAQIRQATVRISLVIDTTRHSLVAVYDRVSSIQNTWNSATFLHWTANTVYCETANLTPIRDEYYRASYVFKWDQWLRCEQVPKVDIQGRPSLDSNGSSATVTWKSLYVGTYNHSLIFQEQPDADLAEQIALRGCFQQYVAPGP
jgi:hypothetical protein